MKIPIDTQREIVRLLSHSTLSNRAIGKLTHVSHNTVRALRDQLALAGENWATLKELDDVAFARRLNLERPGSPLRKAIPQWSEVHEQLRGRDVTLDLLWQEFREQEPNGVSYAQFTRHYRAWLKTQKLSMRQVHAPGDKLFVDFCGRTMPITDPATGQVSQVQVFVGTLGCSGYLFATAVASQTTRDWLHCHVLAMEHLGGVPRFIVPDNLKAAVIKSQRDNIQLNKAYSELAQHYGFTILPARPRKPKDKSLAEVGVQIVQRWVLARLRHHTFFSLEDLNRQISYWMVQLNERTTRTYPKSRLARFLEFDAPVLPSLPERRYDYHQWRYQLRVGADYHVEHEQHHYSVPYHFAYQLVDLRVNAEWLEVVCQRRVIATHRLCRSPGVSTQQEHRAPNHQHFQDAQPEALLAWAEHIGPSTLEFVRRNLAERQDFATGLRAIASLKKDMRQEQVPHARLESACAYALTLGCLGITRLRAILRNESDLRHTMPTAGPTIRHSNIRGAEYYSAQQGETP
ncbi:transposase [Pseudomonas sp. TCU-HL1]|nr:transposase [Pseudomonas sp. TCU-HL1]